ncbi:hypothetical protein [Massilia sp. PWRC2]|uniref:hypothetical protein n=1 Tax=Massilia sp. PWRC2 TaxID=2804626 RepID=UPI003CF7EC2F
MEELLKSFKAQMYDRVSSPLTFSFVLSWCVWNYRFLMVMIGTGPAAEKFVYVEQHLFATWEDIARHGFIYPLCSALAYIYIYPWPARKVYIFSQTQAMKMKKAQQTVEDQTPISEEEAAELRANMRKEKRERAEELERADKEIKQLRDDLARREVKPTAAEALYPVTVPTSESKDLTDAQKFLLHTIANAPKDYLDDRYLNGETDGSLASRKNNVAVLMERKLIKDRFDARGRFLQATPLGCKYLVTESVEPAVDTPSP